jgi:hypothetical protein
LLFRKRGHPDAISIKWLGEEGRYNWHCGLD